MGVTLYFIKKITSLLFLVLFETLNVPLMSVTIQMVLAPREIHGRSHV